MKSVGRKIAIAVGCAAFCAIGVAAVRADSHVDRRVVDQVDAGDAMSEAHHGYVGDSTVAGTFQGKPFRQAHGWMRYALTTFDDTELTVACTFVATDNASHTYDVVVEDSVVATRTFPSTVEATSVAPTVVEIAVPFVLTKGKTNVAVVVRARGGFTPALQQVRTIQNHNEF